MEEVDLLSLGKIASPGWGARGIDANVKIGFKLELAWQIAPSQDQGSSSRVRNRAFRFRRFANCLAVALMPAVVDVDGAIVWQPY